MGNLTEVGLRSALKNRRPGVTLELADGTVPGLCLRIGPYDATWSLRYRVTGKQHRISLGEYPHTSLQAARALANTAVESAKAGDDPAAVLEANSTAHKFDASPTCKNLYDRLRAHERTACLAKI